MYLNEFFLKTGWVVILISKTYHLNASEDKSWFLSTMKNISFLLLAVIFGIAAENVVARYLLVDVDGDVERRVGAGGSNPGGS